MNWQDFCMKGAAPWPMGGDFVVSAWLKRFGTGLAPKSA